MKILAFDTTNVKPSIALFEDGEIVDLIAIEENQKMAELLVVKIEEILSSNNISYQDLDAIGFSKGPASFTSVRIGLSVIKSLMMTLKIPFFGFDSLFLIANKYSDFEGEIFVAMDAKMDEFFVSKFFAKNGEIEILEESKLIEFKDFENLSFEKSVLICGSAKEILEKILTKKKFSFQISDNNDEFSSDILSFLTYDKMILDKKGDKNFDPIYLRNPKIGARKS